MPPLALYPNLPPGASDITSYGYGGGMAPQQWQAYGGQQPAYNPNDPLAFLNQMMAVYNSPIGQQAQAAQQQTIAMNVRQALAAMQNERDRIAIAQGQAEADRWYREQQVQLAQQAHALAVQAQQQNYGLAVGGLTGMFNGQPTLAAQNQQQQYALDQARLALAQLTQQQQYELANGTLNLATLTQQQRNAIDQAQLGLTQAGITGEFNGRPTLAAIAQQQNFGLAQAGITGMYGGAPTEAARQFSLNYGLQAGQQSGYGPGGAPTLEREQAAANTALQAAQLGASLRGPGDWAQYLQAANAVAGSPVSALVSSAPGGLGMMEGDGGGPMTLGRLLGQFGAMPGQGGGPYGTPTGAAPGAQTPESGWYGPGGTGVPGLGQQGAVPLNPAEQSRIDEIVSRRQRLQAAGQGDVSPEDLAELQRYQARGGVAASMGAGWQGSPMPGAQGQQPWNLGYYGTPDAGQGAPYGGGGAGGYMVQQPDGTWAPGGGSMDVMPGQQMWAGGSPTFNERTGTYGGTPLPTSYSAAPAGGMRRTMTSPVMGRFPNVDPITGGSTLPGRYFMAQSSGGLRFDPNSPDQTGGPMRQTSQGWNPYSMTGAIGQAAQPWQPTAQQLGFQNDDEMNTVKGYFQNPNSAPVNFWESKSRDQRAYLGGLNEKLWGGSQNTFEDRYRNSRPRQGAWNAAV